MNGLREEGSASDAFDQRRVPLALVRLTAALVVAIALFALGPKDIPGTPAVAFACDFTSHCHGATRWSPANSNDAAIAAITTYDLGVGDQCTEAATSELWEGTDSAGFTYWVESGAEHGEHNDLSCGSGLQWFWADNRPTYGYNEHYTGTFTLNTKYTVKIAFDGCSYGVCTWEIDRNGSNVGFSNSNPCCSTAMQAGAETTTNSVYDYGEATGLQKRINGTWSYNWPGAAVYNPESFFSMTGTPSSDEFYYHCCTF
jgi:hypothetical protein